MAQPLDAEMKVLRFLALLAVCAAPQAKAEGSWLARLQAVSFQPANRSEAGAGLSEDAFSLSSKTLPEVSLTYFCSPKVSIELGIATPAQHTVTLEGNPIGTLRQLSPTLTAQWHFWTDEYLNAYLGAGLNYTTFSNLRVATLPMGALSLSDPRWGPVLQCGADLQIAPRWVFNVDARYLRIRSDLRAGSSSVGKVFLDPLLLSAGVGIRF